MMEAQSPPRNGPAFESGMVQFLRSLVNDLPSGTASVDFFQVQPPLSHPGFKILPNNPKAAQITGYIVSSDVYLTIGKAASRELFAKGGNFPGDATINEEIKAVWDTVVSDGFTETIWLDKNDRVLRAVVELRLNNSLTVQFSYGNSLLKMLKRASKRVIQYEPYLSPPSA